jgi:hypothetical protein
MGGGLVALLAVMGAFAAAGCQSGNDSGAATPGGVVPSDAAAQIQQRSNDMAAEAAKAKAGQAAAQAAQAAAQGQH